jgi:hypothetical protein
MIGKVVLVTIEMFVLKRFSGPVLAARPVTESLSQAFRVIPAGRYIHLPFLLDPGSWIPPSVDCIWMHSGFYWLRGHDDGFFEDLHSSMGPLLLGNLFSFGTPWLEIRRAYEANGPNTTIAPY